MEKEKIIEVLTKIMDLQIEAMLLDGQEALERESEAFSRLVRLIEQLKYPERYVDV